MEDLLALRGKISIDYDREREEEAELKAAEDRKLLPGHRQRSRKGEERSPAQQAITRRRQAVG